MADVDVVQVCIVARLTCVRHSLYQCSMLLLGASRILGIQITSFHRDLVRTEKLLRDHLASAHSMQGATQCVREPPLRDITLACPPLQIASWAYEPHVAQLPWFRQHGASDGTARDDGAYAVASQWEQAPHGIPGSPVRGADSSADAPASNGRVYAPHVLPVPDHSSPPLHAPRADTVADLPPICDAAWQPTAGDSALDLGLEELVTMDTGTRPSPVALWPHTELISTRINPVHEFRSALLSAASHPQPQPHVGAHAGTRGKACPIDRRLGYSAEEWTRLPRALSDRLARMSSTAFVQLWRATVEEQISLRGRYFALLDGSVRRGGGGGEQGERKGRETVGGEAPLWDANVDEIEQRAQGDVHRSDELLPGTGRAAHRSSDPFDVDDIVPWHDLGVNWDVSTSMNAGGTPRLSDTFARTNAAIVQQAVNWQAGTDDSWDSAVRQRDAKRPRLCSPISDARTTAGSPAGATPQLRRRRGESAWPGSPGMDGMDANASRLSSPVAGDAPHGTQQAPLAADTRDFLLYLRLVAQSSGRQASVELGALVPPATTGRRVAAQAFRHVLELATRGYCVLQQSAAYAAITMQLVPP
ncbi:hypothetical protein MSPP1_003729 [Malassezia sp. CBS 17886]|nr:hypothetical protein MSPP1_003729 [Malassezia sp. CBS 17886]